MISIDLAVECPGWPAEEALEELTATVLQATCAHPELELPEGAEVSLVFTNDEHVQQLNKQWRQQDKPTNVLSFAANEGSPVIMSLLGDIVLALETLEREALEQEKSFDHHLKHLIVHGFLHLLGFDHIEDTEAEEMEALETQVLKTLSIADPYASL